MFNTEEKLTKNQIDTIIRKAKQFNIKLQKDPYLRNNLVFKTSAEKIQVADIGEITTSYINGEIAVDPFDYDIYINEYSLNSFSQIIDLKNVLMNVYEFLEWLKNYLSTRIK